MQITDDGPITNEICELWNFRDGGELFIGDEDVRDDEPIALKNFVKDLMLFQWSGPLTPPEGWE